MNEGGRPARAQSSLESGKKMHSRWCEKKGATSSRATRRKKEERAGEGWVGGKLLVTRTIGQGGRGRANPTAPWSGRREKTSVG